MLINKPPFIFVDIINNRRKAQNLSKMKKTNQSTAVPNNQVIKMQFAYPAEKGSPDYLVEAHKNERGAIIPTIYLLLQDGSTRLATGKSKPSKMIETDILRQLKAEFDMLEKQQQPIEPAAAKPKSSSKAKPKKEKVESPVVLNLEIESQYKALVELVEKGLVKAKRGNLRFKVNGVELVAVEGQRPYFKMKLDNGKAWNTLPNLLERFYEFAAQ